MIRYVELDDFYDMPDTANNNLVSCLHCAFYNRGIFMAWPNAPFKNYNFEKSIIFPNQCINWNVPFKGSRIFIYFYLKTLQIMPIEAK